MKGPSYLRVKRQVNEPDAMSFRVASTLIAMTAILSVVLIVSNIAALKIWQLKFPYPAQIWPIKRFDWLCLPVDAGILLFPISYAVGDLLMNIYGRKIADLVALWSAILSMTTAVILWIAKVILPDYPGADNSAFVVAQDAMGRIFLASVVGFLASQVLNNYVFAQMRAKEEPANEELSANFRRRAIISSVIARIADVVIFETLAFFGKLPLMEFLRQMAFAYVAGVIIELVISRLTARIAKKLRIFLQYEDGKDLR